MFLAFRNVSVYLLDGDLGQPMLTPAGCVSLFKIDMPLLGLFPTRHFVDGASLPA